MKRTKHARLSRIRLHRVRSPATSYPPRRGPDRPTRYEEAAMGDTGWLIVAIVTGVLAAVGWIARERWIMRRRRRR